MEEQYNFDLEPVNAKETLTYMVGQLPLRGTPSHNLVYSDPEGRYDYYIMDIGDGTLTIHADIKIPIPVPISVLKDMESTFILVVAGLYERGLRHIDTWIQDTPQQLRYAQFFGFEETGFLKILRTPDGEETLLKEMRYLFPILDES